MTHVVLLSLLLQLGAARGASPAATFCVHVDSTRREVILTAGPFRVAPADHAMSGMHGGGGGNEQQGEVLVQRFSWPATVWVRGYRLRLFDARGRALPRRWIHHLYVVDFDRRELVYPIAQRVFGMGRETPDVMLRSTIGIPVSAGHDLGLYLMWDNDTGAEVDGVYLELAFRWTASSQAPSPLQVFPFFVDAHVALGSDWSFEVPPGGGSATYEFTLPISGRLRMAGGHLHDHGLTLRLEDGVTGVPIVTLRAQRDSSGRLLGVPYRILAVRDSGPHLVAGRRYRLVATYDNPTPRPLAAVMGTLAGLFAPDSPERWPSVDTEDPTFELDRRLLTTSHPGGGAQAGACQERR